MSAVWTRQSGFPQAPRARQQEHPWNLGRYARLSLFETERCVFWVLEGLLDFQVNVDFAFQRRLPVRGINQTGLNRSDFWCWGHGKAAAYGVGAPPYERGRVLNPVSFWTHRNKAKDDFERTLIRQQAHIDVVYLLDNQLYAAPKRVVEAGLAGIDTSGH